MKKSTDAGFYYCPYIPQLDTTWQAYLTKLQADYVAWTKLGQQCEGDGLADANEMMQACYPGPYHIVERYDPQKAAFTLQLEFDDPREKTMFLLKWS